MFACTCVRARHSGDLVPDHKRQQGSLRPFLLFRSSSRDICHRYLTSPLVGIYPCLITVGERSLTHMYYVYAPTARRDMTRRDAGAGEFYLFFFFLLSGEKLWIGIEVPDQIPDTLVKMGACRDLG